MREGGLLESESQAEAILLDACRFAWKNKHPKPENWKSTRVALCPVCGKEFLASREYKSKRKYCSHACANRGRAMEKRAAAEKEGSHDLD